MWTISETSADLARAEYAISCHTNILYGAGVLTSQFESHMDGIGDLIAAKWNGYLARISYRDYEDINRVLSRIVLGRFDQSWMFSPLLVIFLGVKIV